MNRGGHEKVKSKRGLLFEKSIRNACLSALRKIFNVHLIFSGQQYLYIRTSKLKPKLTGINYAFFD